MSTLFSDYEREYEELSRKISKRITLLADQDGEAKKQTSRAAQVDLDEAERVLSQMDLELRSLAPAQRSKLTPRLRNYQADIATLRKDLKRADETSARDSRRDLLGASGGGAPRDIEAAEVDQRARLLKNYDRLNSTSDRLANAQRVALESEQIGVNVLGDLHEQRDVIVRARDNVDKADESVGRSRRLIQAMNRRVVTNKIIMALIIIVLLGTLGVIVYFKFIKKSTPSSSNNNSSSATTTTTTTGGGNRAFDDGLRGGFRILFG